MLDAPTILRTSIPDVSVAILRHWLRWNWLELSFEMQHWRDAPTGGALAWMATGGRQYLVAEGGNEQRASFHFSDERSTELVLELQQWRLSAVELYCVIYAADSPILASLQDWLRDRYSYLLLERELTPRQREIWNRLQWFTDQVQSGRSHNEVEDEAGVQRGTLRKTWRRLYDEIGTAPPWPI